MVADTNEHRGAFPADRPVDGLRMDHDMLRKLAQAYYDNDSLAAKISAAEQILMLLETHSLLEEQVFYPAVRQVDASMISHFEEAHHKIDDIMATIKRISLKDGKALPMFEQMLEMTLDHINEEENAFFPKLDNARIDMTELGEQMQIFEATAVLIQAQATAKPRHHPRH